MKIIILYDPNYIEIAEHLKVAYSYSYYELEDKYKCVVIEPKEDLSASILIKDYKTQKICDGLVKIKNLSFFEELIEIAMTKN